MIAEARIPKVLILWEEELRTAAEMLHKITVLGKNVKASDIDNALRACYAAIYHPDIVSGAPIIIMSAHKGEDETK